MKMDTLYLTLKNCSGQKQLIKKSLTMDLLAG